MAGGVTIDILMVGIEFFEKKLFLAHGDSR
jgi:hypothetical protein